MLDARGEDARSLVFSGGDGKAAIACIANDDQSGTLTAEAHEIPGSAKAACRAGHMGVHELFVVDNGAPATARSLASTGPTA